MYIYSLLFSSLADCVNTPEKLCICQIPMMILSRSPFRPLSVALSLTHSFSFLSSVTETFYRQRKIEFFILNFDAHFVRKRIRL